MKYLSLVILLLTSFAAGARELPWLQLFAMVREVKSGDVFRAVDHRRVVHLVRLSGCDAPELGQTGGKEARRELRELILDKQVRIRHRYVDARGRTLGQVYVGKTWVNRAMIASGLAWHYDPYDEFPALQEVEAHARRNDSGLWSEERPIPPWWWRRGKIRPFPQMEEKMPRLFPRRPSSNQPQLISR